jgi:hypothetical protein
MARFPRNGESYACESCRREEGSYQFSHSWRQPKGGGVPCVP